MVDSLASLAILQNRKIKNQFLKQFSSEANLKTVKTGKKRTFIESNTEEISTSCGETKPLEQNNSQKTERNTATEYKALFAPQEEKKATKKGVKGKNKANIFITSQRESFMPTLSIIGTPAQPSPTS